MSFEQTLMAAGFVPRAVVPDGKWRRCYEALMAKRRAIPIPADTYCERHHILPKALGGSDQSENIVALTAREHFIAHLLLARIFGGTMWLAVIRMKGRRNGNGYVNSKLYAQARSAWAAWSSANQRGEAHWAYGKPGATLGRKMPHRSGSAHPGYGKPMPEASRVALLKANQGSKRSEESRKKIGDAQRGELNHAFGKSLTEEHRAKVAAAMRERRLSNEHKARIGAAHKGRKFSDETIQRMRDAAQRREAKKRELQQ